MTQLWLLFLFAYFPPVFMFEFQKHPQTQHVINNTSAVFSCLLLDASTTYWDVMFSNGSKQIYRLSGNYFDGDIRVVLERNTEIDNTVYMDLTISAYLRLSHTQLRCVGINGGRRLFSEVAFLFVYMSLRPLPPYDVQVSPINATALLIEWTPSYLWDGYAIDYYKINISNTVFINSSIPQLIHLNTSVVPFVSCSLLNFSVSAVNVYYGESDPTTAITQFDAAPGNFIHTAINDILYFYPNGTPFLSLQVKFPVKLCVNQQINYTIVIEDINHGVVILVGPFTYNQQESRIVSKDIIGMLKRDHNYTVKVQVVSIAGISESEEIFFSTVLNLSSKTCATKGNYHVLSLTSYTIAIGVSLAVAVLTLSALVVGVMCQYVCFTRKMHRTYDTHTDMSARRVCNSMVNNPVYEGSLYESVDVKFATLLVADAQLEATNNAETPAKKIAHYVDYFSEPMPILSQLQDSFEKRMEAENVPMVPLPTQVGENQIKLE